jgi:hypothetical protein
MQTQLIARILYSIVLTVAIGAFQTFHYSNWAVADLPSQPKTALNGVPNKSASRTILQPVQPAGID